MIGYIKSRHALSILAVDSFILLQTCACIASPVAEETSPTPFLTTSSPPSQTASPTDTPLPTSLPPTETIQIGLSVEGRPILATRIGTGSRYIIVLGAIHGFERNTTWLIDDLIQEFNQGVPVEVRFYFISKLNPDGYENRTRLNANQVDLNRNWDTSTWSADTCYDEATYVPGGGGSRPLSEPETAAFASWLLALSPQTPFPITIVSYHNSYEGGLVFPGYYQTDNLWHTYEPAAQVGTSFSASTGYTYTQTWPFTCTLSGDLTNWGAENGMPVLLVELHTDRKLTSDEVLIQKKALLQLVNSP